MGGVHRIRYSLHYYLNYLFIKQQPLHSVTSNLLFSVTILCTTSLTPLFLECPCVSIPVPFLSLFCLGWKVCLLACSPLLLTSFLAQRSLYPTPPTYHQRFPGWKWATKLADGPEPPATEASNHSLCCTNNAWLQLRLEVQRFSTVHPYILTSVNFNNLVKKYKEYFMVSNYL